MGLSPRVRGNLANGKISCAVHGPIPACAGQPLTLEEAIVLMRAYPRVCGATLRGIWHKGKLQGLSPRVRGNPS